MRRVVVHRMGTVNPLAHNVEEFWSRSRREKVIGPLTKFDALAYPAQIAGEVKEFDPSTLVDKALRSMADFRSSPPIFGGSGDESGKPERRVVRPHRAASS